MTPLSLDIPPDHEDFPADLRSIYELVWGSLAASVLYPARLRVTPLILPISGIKSYVLRLEAVEIVERGFVRARHEISVSNISCIWTNCIVPFSVERVGTNIYFFNLLF